MYVGRYAPSPTGDLHLGNVLAAFYAYARAKQFGGRFLLRIDDTDAPRVKPHSAARITDDLLWLGFEFDKLGHHDNFFYTQSQRLPAYDQALEKLREGGHLFACSCSRKEVQAASAPHDLQKVYPGTCEHKGLHFENEVAWRMRVNSDVQAHDAFAGDFSKTREAMNGFIFASACDVWSRLGASLSLCERDEKVRLSSLLARVKEGVFAKDAVVLVD